MLGAKQRGVLRGMATGASVTVAALGLAIVASPQALMPDDGLAAALAHALRWDLLIAGWLAVNVGVLARHRFVTPEDIDGGAVMEGTPRARGLQAMLTNTLEQSVLAVAVHGGWAVTMPRSWQAAVPVGATLFLVGRLLFWRGWARGAPARAVGFSLTYYPSVTMLFLIAGRSAVVGITP